MDHLYLLKAQVFEILQTQCTNCWVKIPVCFPIALFTFLFGAQNSSILLALLVLVTFDMFMGIMAAYSTKEVISSRRALKTATKLLVYGILASGAYFTESVIPADTFLDDAMISFLALTEFISIMENAGRMGFTVPQKLLNKVQGLRG